MKFKPLELWKLEKVKRNKVTRKILGLPLPGSI